MQIIIDVEVHTIYRTGVEVEAMHGAAITALTIYDMLKPIDNHVEIGSIKLERKEGGKSQYTDFPAETLRCAVVVCSDSVSAGTKQDFAGKAVIEKLQQNGLNTASYTIIPDDFDTIQTKAKQLSAEGIHLILFTGGTGLSKRDVTPEAIEPLIDRPFRALWKRRAIMGRSVRLMPCCRAALPALSISRWCLPFRVLPVALPKPWMRFSLILFTFFKWRKGSVMRMINHNAWYIHLS